MICRMWKGWTARENADAYEDYLRNELFPRVAAELGGRGYEGHHVLRLERGGETEFVTMVWFASLEVGARLHRRRLRGSGHLAEGAEAPVALCRALRPLRAARF